MDKSTPAVLAALLIIYLPQASAASSTDLNVSGMITPSSCTPTLSDGGAIDHGKITVTDLNQDRHTLLPPDTLQLNVRCEGSTLFALTTLDNRGGTAVIPNHHGLGTTPNDENLGSVALVLSNPVADTLAVRTIVSLDGGTQWAAGSHLSHLSLLAIASMDDPPRPIAVTTFDADIVFYTRIARADSLTLNDEVPVDGHVTVTMRYL